ncbi:DNA-binding NarL/FixJ family response regulator [Haloferula luteola]|uniref:DNA-binding NarL/FixJ family response regulator n=1 Tax=Haloferula luteola TaxID=595692 RepID=A0A840UXI9_9BACT|nr:response regulator transcription factor [Haloferula luteola]MBB5350445.1 DNA-binding NarL/FixJ family response regulator [Haloferula luteola]
MKILVVDDHAIVRKGMIALLKEEILGLEFDESGSTEAALHQVLAYPYALVIADITLPGRSGLDLLKDLRSTQPKLPVLIMSALPEKDYAVRAFKLGASGYLSKQSAADTLVTAVSRVLSGGRYVSPGLAEVLVGTLQQTSFDEPHEALSNRELEVLRLIAESHSLKAIAARLDLSEKTIATYRARISAKLGLATNVELTRYAVQRGLIE